MINDLDNGTLPLSAAYAVFGRRYVIDSEVFSNVVYDRVKKGAVKRMMPNPLDVGFAALGNNVAGALRYPEFFATLVAFAGKGKEVTKSLFLAQPYVKERLEKYFDELDVGTGYPRLKVVTVDTCTGPKAYGGVASSYFEKVTTDFARLDVQEWQKTFYPSATRPPEVPWMSDLLTPK